MKPSLSRLASFLSLLAVMLPSSASAWSKGHSVITTAAVQVMPEALRNAWAAPHRSAIGTEEKSIEEWLCTRFCMHPDWVDGPSASGKDIAERMRSTAFVYAEKDGTYTKAVAYTDPQRDPKAPRPWTYHYFTRSDQMNRAFVEAGARWYFTKISEAFRAGDFVAAAEYGGAFAHAIEDRVSPYHVWDGYEKEREALEDSLSAEGLQKPEGSRGGNPKNASLFWNVDGPQMKPDMASYQPVALGKTIEEATAAFTTRIYEARAHAKAIYSDRQGFLAAHLADDWHGRAASAETMRFLNQVGTHNARLLADVLFTAWMLARKS